MRAFTQAIVRDRAIDRRARAPLAEDALLDEAFLDGATFGVESPMGEVLLELQHHVVVAVSVLLHGHDDPLPIAIHPGQVIDQMLSGHDVGPAGRPIVATWRSIWSPNVVLPCPCDPAMSASSPSARRPRERRRGGRRKWATPLLPGPDPPATWRRCG